jgi:hypothetical protein
LGEAGPDVEFVEDGLVDLVGDAVLAVAEDLDDDGLGLVGLLGGFGRLRDEGIEPADSDGLDDHEDDQQHKKNVDERGDVDVGSEFFAGA